MNAAPHPRTGAALSKSYAGVTMLRLRLSIRRAAALPLMRVRRELVGRRPEDADDPDAWLWDASWWDAARAPVDAAHDTGPDASSRASAPFRRR